MPPLVERAAAQEHRRARVLDALSALTEAVFFLDADGRFTWVYSAAERLLPGTPAELVGRSLWIEAPTLAGSDFQTAQQRAWVTRQPQRVELFYQPLGRWLEFRAHRDADELVVFVCDVHDRRARDEELAADLSLIRAVLDALPAQTALLDADGAILATNAAWDAGAAALGLPGSTATAAHYRDVCGAAAAAADDPAGEYVAAEAMAAGLRAVLEGRAASFSYDHPCPLSGQRSDDAGWYHLQAFRVTDCSRVVITHTDVTDRVAAERRAAWQARHDHLTSLPNRAVVYEVISEALAADDGRPVTLLYLDLDDFKLVNDTLGHAAGDVLLRELAQRLAHRTRPTDVVGRLGGDEFVVVARDYDQAGGRALARRFQAAFDEPFDVGGACLPVTASIGLATWDQSRTAGDVGPELLLHEADAAMYVAKAAGRIR